MYYVYTLRCKDGSLYTGLTTNVHCRMRQHLGLIKGGAKYTARRKPVSLVLLWQAEGRTSAARLEYAIKRLTHLDKVYLVAHPEELFRLCPRLEGETYIPIPGTPFSLTSQP